MSWIVVVFVVLLVVALFSLFLKNARFLKRDMNERVDRFRTRLESDANSVLDDLLKTGDSNPQQR
jgi:hypothetical protein